MKLKLKPILVSAFALSVANFAIQRHNNRDGYNSTPTKSEICSVAITLAKDDASFHYNEKTHLKYIAQTTFKGFLKGAFIDEVYSKNFWNIDRYLRQETQDEHADLLKVLPEAAEKCTAGSKSNARELLGLSPNL